MVTGPLMFTTVDGMPAVKQTIYYSNGIVCTRTYQAGQLIDAVWVKPNVMQLAKSDVIEHREIALYNHHYLNK